MSEKMNFPLDQIDCRNSIIYGKILNEYRATVMDCDVHVSITLPTDVGTVLTPEDLNLVAYRAINFVRDEIRALAKEQPK